MIYIQYKKNNLHAPNEPTEKLSENFSKILKNLSLCK